MAKKKHFTGVGEEKIHTAREGTCKSFGSCNYQKNTPDTGVPEPRQSHHIVCVSTTIGYKGIDSYKSYVATIDAVYKNTKWCVNQGPNLKWLPLKGTYLKVKNNLKDGKRVPKGDSGVWALDLPCHDWDHNCKDGYTAEVLEGFKKIWNAICDAKDDGECPEEESATADFKSLENKMKQRLAARGKRKGGTRKAIRAEGEEKWWIPFSMAKTNVAKDRVVHSFGAKPEPPKALARGGK